MGANETEQNPNATKTDSNLRNLLLSSGCRSKSAGVIDAIVKQLKQVNLKPVKRIQIQFDPFTEQSLVTRQFLSHITNPYVLETNLSCPIKTAIVNDRSEPFVKVDLLDTGRSVRFLAGNLTVLEILQQFNKHVSSLVEPEVETAVVETKQEKKKKRRK